MYVLCINKYIYIYIYTFNLCIPCAKICCSDCEDDNVVQTLFFVLTCRITQVPSLSFAPSTVASSGSEGNVSVEYGWIAEEQAVCKHLKCAAVMEQHTIILYDTVNAHVFPIVYDCRLVPSNMSKCHWSYWLHKSKPPQKNLCADVDQFYLWIGRL